MLQNLVANACKVVDPKRDDALVELEALELPHERTPRSRTVRFTVSDTGRGIPLAHQQKVFQEYSSVGVKRGSGMGLPLSKALVELMGGSLTVTSPYREEGTGARFRFILTFPIGKPPSVLVGPDAAVLPKGWRVLVADDVEMCRLSLSMLLKKVEASWTVDEAE